MTRFRFVRFYSAFGLLLCCALMAGCVSMEQQGEAKRRFATQMNGLVGQLTYEDVSLNWGPPTDRHETASEIAGVWEDTSGYGSLTFNPEKNLGGGTGYHGWRVRMVFDRKSMRLKSWEELGSKMNPLGAQPAAPY